MFIFLIGFQGLPAQYSELKTYEKKFRGIFKKAKRTVANSSIPVYQQLKIKKVIVKK